jgi:hypothetical protein
VQRHSFDAVVNAIAHIDVKPPRLTKQGFVAGAAAAVAVAGGVVLGATCSAGRQKKDWGRAGKGGWLWEWLCEVVLRGADISG